MADGLQQLLREKVRCWRCHATTTLHPRELLCIFRRLARCLARIPVPHPADGCSWVTLYAGLPSSEECLGQMCCSTQWWLSLMRWRWSGYSRFDTVPLGSACISAIQYHIRLPCGQSVQCRVIDSSDIVLCGRGGSHSHAGRAQAGGVCLADIHA